MQKVITLCAHCFNSFDRYPRTRRRLENDPAQGADRRTDRRRPPAGSRTRARDDHLPRSMLRRDTNGIVDETRRVLSAVGQLIEMPRTREQSFCCGAGGGNYWGGQGGTARIGDVRIRRRWTQARRSSATACSFCTLMLTASAGKHSETRKVSDVAELVAERIRIVEG
ncbi:MAG: hypothetical protein IPM40_04235 [Gammaproteobacteria bacterium]|nr:hypothetical protein [Gammaproteobacteria bacterium]